MTLVLCSQTDAMPTSNDASATTSDPACTATPATAAVAAPATAVTTAPKIAVAAAACVSRRSPDLLVIGVAGVGQCFLTAQLRRAERIGAAAKKPTIVATISSARAKCSLLRLHSANDTTAPLVMFAVFEDHGSILVLHL